MKFATMDNRPPKVVVDCSLEPSMTKQSFKEECDINNIMAKYRATGLIDVGTKLKEGHYADLADMPDYHTSMNVVIAAQAAFEALPSTLRERFGNDPGKFMDFVSDPANECELVSLGLAVAKPGLEPPTGDGERAHNAGASAPVDGSTEPSKGS